MEDYQIDTIVIGFIVVLALLGFAGWAYFTKLQSRSRDRSGPIGEVGIVIKPVESIVSPGRVKVFADEYDIVWDGELNPLAMNQAVKITGIQGNKVTVTKI